MRWRGLRSASGQTLEAQGSSGKSEGRCCFVATERPKTYQANHTTIYEYQISAIQLGRVDEETGKKMKDFVLAAGFCIAAGQVAAQGLETTASDISWTGYHIGLAVTSGDATLSDGSDSEEYGTQGLGLQFGFLRDTGAFVLGGEFAYVGADFDEVSALSLNSARLKAIGGYDAGRFLPYAFVGLSNVEASVETTLIEAGVNETTANYGLGGRVALGPEGRVVAGLEYLVEEVDDFAGSGIDIDNNDLSLRLDFRY